MSESHPTDLAGWLSASYPEDVSEAADLVVSLLTFDVDPELVDHTAEVFRRKALDSDDPTFYFSLYVILTALSHIRAEPLGTISALVDFPFNLNDPNLFVRMMETVRDGYATFYILVLSSLLHLDLFGEVGPHNWLALELLLERAGLLSRSLRNVASTVGRILREAEIRMILGESDAG